MEHELLSYACGNLSHGCYLETTPLEILKSELEKRWETTNGDWEDDIRFALANIMASEYI